MVATAAAVTARPAMRSTGRSVIFPSHRSSIPAHRWTRERCSAIRHRARRPAVRASSSPRSGRCSRRTGCARASRWVPAGGENFFELRLTAANQLNPLVVYTTRPRGRCRRRCGTGSPRTRVDQPITVSVRGATLSRRNARGRPRARIAGRHLDRAGRGAGRDRLLDDERRHRPRGFKIGDETRAATSCAPADASDRVRRLSLVDARRRVRRVLGGPTAGNGDPATLGMLTADGTQDDAAVRHARRRRR